MALIDGEKPGVIEFLDISETDVPEVIVVAVGAEGAGISSLIDAETASPLEIYLAFAQTTERRHASISTSGTVSMRLLMTSMLHTCWPPGASPDRRPRSH